MKASNAQNSRVQPFPPSPCQPCQPITPVTPVNIVILVSVVTPNFLFRNRIVYLVLFGNDSISHFLDNKLRSAKVFVLNAGMSWSSKIDRFISTGVLCTLDHLCQESGCLCVCVLCPCLSVFLVCLSCCLCVCVSGRRHWCTRVHWTTSLSGENCLWRRTLTYPWESWRVD